MLLKELNKMNNDTLAKILTCVLIVLMTLLIWTVKDTKAAVVHLGNDVTDLKVAVGKLEVILNYEQEIKGN